MNKFNDLLTKKRFYKNQCKLANDKINVIIKNMEPEQRKEVEALFDVGNKNILNPQISQSEIDFMKM